jgi:hypothetical protein
MFGDLEKFYDPGETATAGEQRGDGFHLAGL